MESANRLTGTGGGPASTGRPSAILPGLSVAPSSSSLGALFAREYDQATERLEGQGARARRLDDLSQERRELRRGGFGSTRTEDPSEAPDQAATAVKAEVPRPPPLRAEAAGTRTPPAPLFDSPTPSGPTGAPTAQAPAEIAPGLPKVTTPVGVPLPPVAVAAATAPGASPAPTVPADSGRVDVRTLEGLSTRSATAKPGRPAAPTPTSRPPDTEAVDRAQEILRQIRLHLAPGVQRLTLDLEPATLGRLAIQLTWRPGRVSAIVRAGEDQTLELLEQRESELRAVLAERGIQTDSLRFELGFDGSASEGRTPAGRRAPAPRLTRSPSERPPTALEPRTSPFHSGDTLVDTYA